MLKPPGPKIDTNGEDGKTDNCAKIASGQELEGGAARAPVPILIDFAILLVFTNFTVICQLYQFSPFVGPAVFTFVVILRPFPPPLA